MSPTRRFAIAVAVAAVLLPVSGCDSPSAPAPVEITLETAFGPLSGDPATWPSAPVASGGSVIEIRGTAMAGCGSLQAEASRRERTIQVRISSIGDRSPCPLSRPAWQYYVARISGVTPAEYRLRLNVAGHNRRTLSGVRVLEPG